MTKPRPISLEWQLALRDSGLPPSARHVGHVLSTYMNRQGTCWPAKVTIARGTGLSVRTVDAAVLALESADWLEIEKTRGGRTWKYHAHFPANGATAATLSSGQRGNRRDANVAIDDANVAAIAGELLEPLRELRADARASATHAPARRSGYPKLVLDENGDIVQVQA